MNAPACDCHERNNGPDAWAMCGHDRECPRFPENAGAKWTGSRYEQTATTQPNVSHVTEDTVRRIVREEIANVQFTAAPLDADALRAAVTDCLTRKIRRGAAA